jgi:hypothetical protein
VKKIFFDLKSWGPLKNVKPEAVLIQTWVYPNMSKNGMKISLDCSLKNTGPKHSLATGRSW